MKGSFEECKLRNRVLKDGSLRFSIRSGFGYLNGLFSLHLISLPTIKCKCFGDGTTNFVRFVLKSDSGFFYKPLPLFLQFSLLPFVSRYHEVDFVGRNVTTTT